MGQTPYLPGTMAPDGSDGPTWKIPALVGVISGAMKGCIARFTLEEAPPLLMDLYPARNAYSVIQLARSAKKCIRVRRSTDNVEQDFGFAGGMVDIAGIVAFCGASSGFVTVLYNQMTDGIARNLTQTTAAQQPIIISAGAVVYLPAPNNTIPAIDFTATGAGFNINDQEWTKNAAYSSLFRVFYTPIASASLRNRYELYLASASGYRITISHADSLSYNATVLNGYRPDGAIVYGWPTTVLAMPANNHIFSWRSRWSTCTITADRTDFYGVSLGTMTYDGPSTGNTSNVNTNNAKIGAPGGSAIAMRLAMEIHYNDDSQDTNTATIKSAIGNLITSFAP